MVMNQTWPSPTERLARIVNIQQGRCGVLDRDRIVQFFLEITQPAPVETGVRVHELEHLAKTAFPQAWSAFARVSGRAAAARDLIGGLKYDTWLLEGEDGAAAVWGQPVEYKRVKNSKRTGKRAEGQQPVFDFADYRLSLELKPADRRRLRPDRLPTLAHSELYLVTSWGDGVVDGTIKTACKHQDQSTLTSLNLLTASLGLQLGQVDFIKRIVFPRGAGVTASRNASQYLKEGNHNNYMDVAHRYRRHLDGLSRFTSALPRLLRTAVPANTTRILHVAHPRISPLTLKTIAYLSSRYVRKTGDGGQEMLWTFGIERFPADPILARINTSITDTVVYLSVEEAAYLWDAASEETWPLNDVQLSALGFSADRIAILVALGEYCTKIVGTEISAAYDGLCTSKGWPGLDIEY
ncbi:uncharacterized protein RHOBADRAFT_53829 [Rhodotorula graminis WP1]|uniref:Uncharacterized protein n=1 Tax=Rhodotorula graminis (strain WP1) TaxID=578459 RepID=A0A194S653_RHOGW|nr:uncharacterized protein RHOBADRAFT_53829 [Rhodotorula graminis WP1]KPV74901.1 hypothetical protein RHOBADRAFT_53829 [Rhodotorula graminis WP1]